MQVSDAAAAVYNKIVPSAEAKEQTESEARRHLHRAGDAAKDAGEDIKTSAYEVKEAFKDGARGYGNTLHDRQVVITTVITMQGAYTNDSNTMLSTHLSFLSAGG